MCHTSLSHNIEVCVSLAEHSDPKLPWDSSSEGQVGNKKGYR